MELALPLIAMGGLYIISNQDKTKSKINKINKENYSNLNRNKELPNLENTIENYPVVNKQQISDLTNAYPNPNQATDKYFNKDAYEKQVLSGQSVNSTPKQIYSISGNYMDSQQFKHNNMVPFVGGKPTGYTYTNEFAETILDNMNGNGSQTIKKIEQSPLFKPEDHVQFPYGAPNNSDFYQSRVNPGLKSNNVKPFETINVGPGLNQGYGTNGNGGFNSGMESRDSWLPKTVDELRVETNPKLEYSLSNHEGPAGSQIKNLGKIGRVEKQRPDVFFINSQDRWLTTTGVEKGETLRPIQEVGIVKRQDCADNYKGPAGSIETRVGYAPSEFEKSKRVIVNETNSVTHCNAVGKGPNADMNHLKSHTNYKNNRSSSEQPNNIRIGFNGAVSAVIAPIMDFLRPTRKEECVNNIRIYGEGIKPAVTNNYIVNPNDTTNKTIKQTTMYSPNFNINNQKESSYINNNTELNGTQRDTTSYASVGNVGGSASMNGPMEYTPYYNQTNNDIKSQTIMNRQNQGGLNMFNNSMNINMSKLESDRENTRFNSATSAIKLPPNKENYNLSKGTQQYDNDKICADRMTSDLLQAFKSNPYTHSLTSSV